MLRMNTPQPCEPILVAHLLRPLEDRLLELLRALSADDWQRPTLAPQWKVRGVAAHLLDTELRKLSAVRDRHFPDAPAIASPADLVAFVNRLNREGVAFYGRLSPAVLVSLLETASREFCAFHESLDPFSPAVFGVSWAGESQSLNWFDTARELTERWHHQQQIRLATSRPGIEIPEFLAPVLDCFVRGLPNTYRHTPAAEGTAIRIDITGDCGGSWFLFRLPTLWMLTRDSFYHPAAQVTMPQSIAWRLFTKGLAPEEARDHVVIAGDPVLGEVILHHLAIVG